MSADKPEQVEGLRRAGKLVAETLALLRRAVRPGISTRELDALAAGHFAARGARSGPIVTYSFPGSVCISVGDQVVHGIPGDRRLRSGEIVTFDVAAEFGGYYADAARTVAVGAASRRATQLMEGTRAALHAGLVAAQPGRTLRDIGAAVERTANSRGYQVIRELTGHGIGRRMHEKPTVFNWPAPTANQILEPGLILTIEPMLAAGHPAIVVERDGWTIRTVDRDLSAHEEETIMICDRGPVVLTADSVS